MSTPGRRTSSQRTTATSGKVRLRVEPSSLTAAEVRAADEAAARAAFNSPKQASKSKKFFNTKKSSTSPKASTPKSQEGKSSRGRKGSSNTRSAYGDGPSSPIASATRRTGSGARKTGSKSKGSVAPKRTTRATSGETKEQDVPAHKERRASNTQIDYDDPNNKIFSPGQYHEVDAQLAQKHPVDKKTAPVAKQPVAAPKPAPQPQQTSQEEEEEYEEYEFDPFLFIKNLPPLHVAVPTPHKFCIPPKDPNAPPISLALDLDETLVHCSVQPIENSELTFTVNFNGVDYEVYVRIRPHLQKFLKQVSEWFEIIVFTASQQVYADKLLDILDPKGEYIKHRVFRDSCVCVEGNYLKDLTILGRDMPSVAIIDNSVQAFGFQLDNGIPIESWFDDDDDKELLALLPFLKTLKDKKDVRQLIRKTFRLTEFVNNLPNFR